MPCALQRHRQVAVWAGWAWRSLCWCLHRSVCLEVTRQAARPEVRQQLLGSLIPLPGCSTQPVSDPVLRRGKHQAGASQRKETLKLRRENFTREPSSSHSTAGGWLWSPRLQMESFQRARAEPRPESQEPPVGILAPNTGSAACGKTFYPSASATRSGFLGQTEGWWLWRHFADRKLRTPAPLILFG